MKLKHFTILLKLGFEDRLFKSSEMQFDMKFSSKQRSVSKINKKLKISYRCINYLDDVSYYPLFSRIWRDSIIWKSHNTASIVYWRNDESLTDNDEFNKRLLLSESEWEAEQISRSMSNSSSVITSKKVRL